VPSGYPPAKTGLRGSHGGSFEVAHGLRRNGVTDRFTQVGTAAEHYDLVVVGGGLSGLSAAHFYRKRFGKDARILVLDNHDDFGGHATRNEFDVDGRLLVTYGGSQSLAGPNSFGDVVKGLMAELGIETKIFEQAYDRRLYQHLGTGLFFDRETFGTDRLLTGMHRTPWARFLDGAPISEPARRDLVRLYTESIDYLPGLSPEEKQALLCKVSYERYLTEHCRAHPEVLKILRTFPHNLFAVGIDAVSAWSCYHAVDAFGAFVYPGFLGLGLPPIEPDEPYIYHFPDGNASVARLLVRALIPEAVPGSSMQDVVLSRVDYGLLDRASSTVRIRLNSTVVHANRTADGRGNEGVEIVYARGNELVRVAATHGVFACYHSMIPYLCPDLPRPQRKALSALVRMPFVYTHVALRNWHAFAKLGVHQIVAPGGYHNYVALDFPVSLGDYRCPTRPEEPIVLFMLRVPTRPGFNRREQNRMGRWELLNTPMATFEQRVHDQLGRMLGPSGFVPERDIAGITINRWAHGYAFVPNRLFDPEVPYERRPWVIGRKPWGHWTVANSDAAGSAYLEAAVEQAARAVDELRRPGERA
jgi:spermidine dehydrogenase